MRSKDAKETLARWGEIKELRTFIGTVGLFAQAGDLNKKGKLNLRKFGFKEGDFTQVDEPALNDALNTLFEHAKDERFHRLARRWVAKKVIKLTGYVELLLPRTIVLDGSTRLSLVNSTHAPDWRREDESLLVKLLKDRGRLGVLRHIVHQSLGYFPVIDVTQKNTTQLKMSKEHPGGRERSSEEKSLLYFDSALPIASFSDGVRSFVGLLAAVLSGDYKVILIDEPEAFLHPPLARTLGAELHKLAREQNAQVFVATHSPDFLMGCMQAGTEVSIVRLTYKEGHATARELKPERLKGIMRQPLMRSTGVLGALFHSGAVVCESDSDRAFYQEINERLLAARRGAQGVAFLNAQNKQTIDRIVGPLREMGIPAAAILDLDVLSSGDEFNRLLRAAGVEESQREALANIKNGFYRRCRELNGDDPEKTKKQMKLQGLELLPERERAGFVSMLIKPLMELGIFVVPKGELESWLLQPGDGVGRSDKSKWLMKMFERLGDDPDQPGYVYPQDDDVWAFVDGIAAWLAEPGQGIPPAAP